MAKDTSSKSTSESNSDSTSNSNGDQQKIPPIRIVLNTANTQKSSSSTIAVQANQSQQHLHHDLKRDRLHDARSDNNVLKTGEKVRIKLGIGKQQSSKGNANGESANRANCRDSTEAAQKPRNTVTEQQDTGNNKEEPNTTNYSHLRRITRSSQRVVQTVGNEDEESISSMTSIDENQNTTNNNNCDNDNAQDVAAAGGSSTNADAPRRYKRKKGEITESQLSEHDGPFCLQDYRLPLQNSFELFRNIRKQVDKKLKSLSNVHPRTPHGFRDYMLSRGTYLLDGNKLGNGTNLLMNEDGGLHSVPMGKYHALRNNRSSYSVPNRAKVPLGLPINSPLYDLFIDQEKERYRMRIQHIKEREKLTLAAEQEIIRVYNQAAMAAANQLEPFSACTMLKHQEIYNYVDSDGFPIQASEDPPQDPIKQEGVRTRRRQHERISPPPPPARKGSNTDTSAPSSDTTNKDKAPEQPANSAEESQASDAAKTVELPKKDDTDSDRSASTRGAPESRGIKSEGDDKNGKPETDCLDDNKMVLEMASDVSKAGDELGDRDPNREEKTRDGDQDEKMMDADEIEPAKVKEEPMDTSETKTCEGLEKPSSNKDNRTNDSNIDAADGDDKSQRASDKSAGTSSRSPESTGNDGSNDRSAPMDQDSRSKDGLTSSNEHGLSEDDRRAFNKEVFLSQLQEIDDKWDRIRGEMLVRHRNEADSLHAIQKLEWEWKTKEIGACDVRTTPIIDNTLVPKLDIYSQDY